MPAAIRIPRIPSGTRLMDLDLNRALEGEAQKTGEKITNIDNTSSDGIMATETEGLIEKALMEELFQSGVKYDPLEVQMTVKSTDGKLKVLTALRYI